MNRLSRVLNAIYSKRGRIVTALIVLFMIPAFQNCGGKLSTGGGSIDQSSQVGQSGNPSPTPGPTPAPAPTPAPTIPLAERQAKCKALTVKPIISNMPVTQATAKSGLGNANSGNADSAALSITANRGVTNQAEFDALTCESQFNLQVNCSVVTNDATNYPIVATNAFDVNGNSLMGTRTPAQIAAASYMNNNCNAGFAQGSSNVTISFRPNTNNERCVDASFWVRVVVRSEIGNLGNLDSDPKFVKVTMNNGCWVESRLKDSAGNLPGVINFGTAVAINGGWAAVVAPTEDASATVIDVGAVYMYKLEGEAWVQKQKIMIPDSISSETLASVGINKDANAMVIGSPYRNSKGMVYFFSRSADTWTLIQQVDPQSTQSGQEFGQALAITPTHAFVGAPSLANGTMTRAGGVLVYTYTSAGLTYVKTLYGEAAYNAFGSSVACNGSNIAVGAPQSLGKEAQGSGSAYVFTEAGGEWTQVVKKIGGSVGERFGGRVAIFGTKLAVSAPNFLSGTIVAAGRVSLYSDYTTTDAPKTWVGTAESPNIGTNLGQGLALSAKGIYIGIPYSTSRQGNFDFYDYTNLNAVYYRGLSYNGTPNNAFGGAIAAYGDYVIVGARIKNDPNDNSGAAYIYRYK